MSDYGVTPEGFIRPSFDEIRQEIVDEFREVFGAINTGSESAIGQQISIMAEREALLWDAAEAVYLNQYPASAAGRSLDGAAQLTGVTRLSATRSTAVVQVEGDNGINIPAGSQVSNDDGDVFETLSSVTLDSEGEGEVQVRALQTGPVPVFAGSITNIETPVSGWDSVTNVDDGSQGRGVETDPQLRLRRDQSLAVRGAGTAEAIRARLLQDVDDVTSVAIIENRTDETDADGRPPHSFETVVEGGADQEVADLIWQVKPAGIETVGGTTLDVEDSSGELQSISFSRPTLVYIWVNVTLEANGVGTFPPDADELAADAVLEFGEELGLGDNVIFQALFGPIYREVPGLANATIEIGESSDPETPPASFDAANIDIALNELSAWSLDRIEVTIDD